MTLKVGFIGLGIMGKPMSKTSSKQDTPRWFQTIIRRPWPK